LARASSAAIIGAGRLTAMSGSSANEGQVGQAGPRRYRQGRPCVAPPALGPERSSSSCWRGKSSLNRVSWLPGPIPELSISSCRFPQRRPCFACTQPYIAATTARSVSARQHRIRD
jgi:hypothetical protein